MADPVSTRSRVRFGVFELDLRSGELRKSGVLIHLSPQPVKILGLLVSHTGELVTREQIRDQIWSSETYVDFEHGLNFCIKRIRDALGDDSESPRYIETLPRRGYRFIPSVQWLESPELASTRDDSGAGGAKYPAVEPVSQQPRSGSALTPPAGRRAMRRFLLYAAVGALVLVAAAVIFLKTPGLGEWSPHFPRHSNPLPERRIESIAVLPLENLSSDPDQEYLADGLTDTLITDLGQMSALRVISRASVMRYKRTAIPLSRIAGELNVDALVEGTVRRSGRRVRVTAQLLDAEADRHLWAQTYERSIEDVMALEKDVALAIAHEISGRLTPVQETRMLNHSPVNLAAYDAYLHGRQLLGERTPEGESGAREYFKEALHADSDFALAWTGLADCYAIGWNGNRDLPRAAEYARKAVSLAPDMAEAHASLGIIDVYQHRPEEGAAELRRSIDLNPNYSMAHHWYSLYLLSTGNIPEALAENERARQLNPFSLPINYLRAHIFLAMHEYDRAASQFEFAASLSPGSPAPHQGLMRIDWIEGKGEAALAEQRTIANLAHDPDLLEDQKRVASAYIRNGLHSAQIEAVRLKEQRYRQDQQKPMMPGHAFCSAFDIALLYALLHDRENALLWLRRAVEDKSAYLLLDFISAPELDFLASDPRFALLKYEFLAPNVGAGSRQ